MKRIWFLLVALSLIISGMLGCNNGGRIIGSGKIVTEKKNLVNFSKVTLGAGHTTIVKSNLYQVTIKIDENLIPYLRVNQNGNHLEIDLDNVHATDNLTLDIEIAMPDLEGVYLQGITTAEISDFNFDHAIEFKASGISQLSGTLTVGEVKCTLSGQSEILLSGKGKSLMAKASGMNILNLSDFICHNVDIDFSGQNQGTVNLTGTLNANLSGASILQYLGTPQIGNISTSGSSSITKATQTQ